MDDETRAALELTAEDLQAMRQQGRPTGVAKVPPAPSLATDMWTRTTTTFDDHVPGMLEGSNAAEDVVDVGEPVLT